MAQEMVIVHEAQRWDGFQLVVFDFDGTLCLGDDPVLTYAQRVDEALAERSVSDNGTKGHPTSRRVSVREAVQRGLDAGDLNVPEIRFDDDGYPVDIAGRTDMALWPLQDGYQLVQLLGLQAGLTSVDTHAAFRASRTQLLDHGLATSDVHAPDGADEIISQLQEEAAVVLITNSPAENFDVWLTQLGLEYHFDLIINSAKKPTGMAAAVDHARTTLQHEGEAIPMEAVVSIGDIWGNDLAYVHEHGGHTILIDRFSTGLGTPDHRVQDAASALALLHHQKATSK
ncbi:HAD family hydrolase [Enteractinococcus fodinae]|uniref:FMN phosphatase YigB (HAD superfamily) n=1 Tax=Enteractinococcus fodinae TaxID=684663 RepID=A0ABU2B7C8_9MICC|nr:HAD family hydrolase [Enteractinococcus fodinae]MDR7348294.1 FMN phosphatase YigB (HAD superfamily) [Enteractinococcus fodinae]